MAEGLNRVMLLGNLGADPELRYTQGGQPVLHLRMATTETYFDKDRARKERTDWHSVTVWGKRAEGLAKILSKGTGIFVEGSLRTGSFEGRDGVKRQRTEVNARNVVLTGGGRSRAAAEDPAGRPPAAEREPAESPGPPPAAFPEEDYAASDDDIPF